MFSLAAKLNKFIEQKNEKNAISDTLLIENVKTYDRGMKLIKEEVMGVTKLFKQMWEVLKDPLPNLNAILEICSENFQKINDVNGLYSSLIVINNNSFELKALMDIYCSHIIYDELMSAQVNKDIQLANPMEVGISIKQDIDYLRKKYNIYDQKTAVISISSNLENMNQIIWASKNSLNIFGVSEAQIIGTSINEWMPSCYSQVHDQILNNFFKTGREVKINNIMHTFALDNQSLCYSTNMMVKIIPSIQNYEMMALFHKLNQDDYFITFNDGTISSVGKTFRKLIDIDPKFLRKNRLNIQLFVPKILPIFQDYFEDHTDECSKEPLIKNDTRYREFLGAQEGCEIKFYFFIPINMEKYIKQQVELKGQFQKDFQQQAQTYKDSKQRSVAFKEKYHEYLIKGINQHTPRRLSKLIRFKCLVLEDRYYNGVKNQSSFIFKIISHEEKFLNQEQMVKMKKQQNILKKYCKALKISHDKAKTQSKQEEKEIEQQDEEGDAKQSNSDQQKEKKKVSNVFNIIGRLKNGRRASNLRGNKQGLLFGDKNGGTDKQNEQSENEKKDNKEPELTEEEKQQQQQKNAIQTILLLMKGQNTNPYITIGVQQKMEWVSEEYVKKQNEEKKSFQRSGTNQIDIIGATDNNSNRTVSRESLRFNQRKNSRLGSRKLSFMNQKSIQSLDLRRINYVRLFLKFCYIFF
ncbi:PAS domain [Pseudocohnilembus persalinus]|uniref:PAS domain n=1 Tax=Pseudocohnilembus persalinus TaxID=266149 RepID=A0A0V0Q979_PSEPJ|nr:PAS domain [Pseudocohnilembus persalinus]|eukprot:KRW98766.1 PAS domain [Pseudocohnilembus persalinus]